MALINCPECSNQISDKARSCPNCAFPLYQYVSTSNTASHGNTSNIASPSISQRNASTYKPWTPVIQKPSRSIWDSGTICPRCRSSNVQILADALNTQQIVKGKKIVTKRRKSALRIGAAIATAGLSLAVTGVNRNNLQVFCRDCGNRWRTK